jgi:hypothetical protein
MGGGFNTGTGAVPFGTGYVRKEVTTGFTGKSLVLGNIEFTFTPPTGSSEGAGEMFRVTTLKGNIDDTPVCCTLRELGPLEWRQVRRTDDEKLCCGLIETHHYLGYTQPVGEASSTWSSPRAGPSRASPGRRPRDISGREIASSAGLWPCSAPTSATSPTTSTAS